MNDDIKHLFQQYLLVATDPTAAAVLVLTEVLSKPTPVVADTGSTDSTVSVQEAASRLGTSSKNIYQLCLAGKLRCTRFCGTIRISTDEIERILNQQPRRLEKP